MQPTTVPTRPTRAPTLATTPPTLTSRRRVLATGSSTATDTYSTESKSVLPKSTPPLTQRRAGDGDGAGVGSSSSLADLAALTRARSRARAAPLSSPSTSSSLATPLLPVWSSPLWSALSTTTHPHNTPAAASSSATPSTSTRANAGAGSVLPGVVHQWSSVWSRLSSALIPSSSPGNRPYRNDNSLTLSAAAPGTNFASVAINYSLVFIIQENNFTNPYAARLAVLKMFNVSVRTGTFDAALRASGKKQLTNKQQQSPNIIPNMNRNPSSL